MSELQLWECGRCCSQAHSSTPRTPVVKTPWCPQPLYWLLPWAPEVPKVAIRKGSSWTKYIANLGWLASSLKTYQPLSRTKSMRKTRGSWSPFLEPTTQVFKANPMEQWLLWLSTLPSCLFKLTLSRMFLILSFFYLITSQQISTSWNSAPLVMQPRHTATNYLLKHMPPTFPEQML